MGLPFWSTIPFLGSKTEPTRVVIEKRSLVHVPGRPRSDGVLFFPSQIARPTGHSRDTDYPAAMIRRSTCLWAFLHMPVLGTM